MDFQHGLGIFDLRESLPRTQRLIIYLAQKTVEDVLLNFADKVGLARRRYRQFVKDGIAMGRRPEFQGGGLVRSAGGDPAGLLGRTTEERELSDARILGSGDFVNAALRKAGEACEKGRNKKIPLSALIKSVAALLDLKSEAVVSSSRRRELSKAMAIISCLAVNELGYSECNRCCQGFVLQSRKCPTVRC